MDILPFQIFRFRFRGFRACLYLIRRLPDHRCRLGILALNGKPLDQPSLDFVSLGVDLRHSGHKALDVARQVLITRIRRFLQLIRGTQPSPPDGPLLLQYHFIPNPLNGRLAVDFGLDLFDHFQLSEPSPWISLSLGLCPRVLVAYDLALWLLHDAPAGPRRCLCINALVAHRQGEIITPLSEVVFPWV